MWIPMWQCETSTCNQDTGYCHGTAYHGNKCNQTCPERCYNCSKSDGTCLHCAEPSFYGNACEKTCSSLCLNYKCKASPGKCIKCSFINSFGEFCNRNCSQNCVGSCSRYSGKCRECIPGYYGNHCLNECSQGCRYNSCDQETGNCRECKPGSSGRFCSKYRHNFTYMNISLLGTKANSYHGIFWQVSVYI